jgi:hypothetical protein
MNGRTPGKKRAPGRIILSHQLQPIKNDTTDIFRVHSATLSELNTAIKSGFLNHQQDADVKRTHLFNGRYENIYLTSEHVPELTLLLDEACAFASKILNTDKLQAGCWFNSMPPGSITTAHSHDDYDELLSAAYYVTVPRNSGNLVIHEGSKKIEIEPEEGMFVFFKPDVVHEVTENLSQEDRLSIGINFGKK